MYYRSQGRTKWREHNFKKKGAELIRSLRIEDEKFMFYILNTTKSASHEMMMYPNFRVIGFKHLQRLQKILEMIRVLTIKIPEFQK